MRIAFILAFVLAIAACECASQADAGAGDPRIQTVPYREDEVVLIEGTPGFQITLEFAADEQIDSIAMGDTSAWLATPNRRGDHIFLKPIRSGARTNMVVVTDVRIYTFELAALTSSYAETPYRIRFEYPPPASATVASTLENAAPEKGRYKFKGAKAIRPSGIHDDCVRTYMIWDEDAALPAVFAADEKGNERLVNGHMRDGVYVIDAVLPRLVFRLDRQVAKATRLPVEAD